MTALETKVGSIHGPGSVEFPVSLNLAELRTKLVKASHPLGHLPQWNGESIYTVSCGISGDHSVQPVQAVVIVSAKDSERASEIAVANLKTRNGPDWEALTSEKLEFDSSSLIKCIRLSPELTD